MKKTTNIKIAVTSEQLAIEYRSGATLRQLASKYGCSFQNINIRLINTGVTMRPTRIRVLPDHVCPTCKKTFQPHNRYQVFCRHECVRIKDTCKRGHTLTEDNRYHYPSGNSRCKQCQSIRDAAYRARKKARQS